MCKDLRTEFDWKMGCGMFSDQEGQRGKTFAQPTGFGLTIKVL